MIQGLMRWLRSPLLTGWSVVVVDGGRELPLVGVWSREAAQTRAQLLAVEHPGLAFRACPIAR